MKQIKTISHPNCWSFDEQVNAALQDGWELVRRTTFDGEFLAELEREVITEAEKCCENCANYDTDPEREPCCNCPNGEMWTEAET